MYLAKVDVLWTDAYLSHKRNKNQFLLKGGFTHDWGRLDLMNANILFLFSTGSYIIKQGSRLMKPKSTWLKKKKSPSYFYVAYPICVSKNITSIWLLIIYKSIGKPLICYFKSDIRKEWLSDLNQVQEAQRIVELISVLFNYLCNFLVVILVLKAEFLDLWEDLASTSHLQLLCLENEYLFPD